MGTRSDIIAQRADGKWHRIYCHWDGYLAHNGKVLFEHYQDQKKIDQLVKLGDLSSLGAEIGKKHSFEWRAKAFEDFQAGKITQETYNKRIEAGDSVCTFYGRDRGEKDVSGTVGDSLEAVWPEKGSLSEFTYVWAGQWYVADPDDAEHRLINLITLADALSGKEKITPLVKAFGLGVIGQHKPYVPS